jgi:hypothetical protein
VLSSSAALTAASFPLFPSLGKENDMGWTRHRDLPLVPLIEGAMAMHLHSHAGLTTTTAFGVPGSGPLGRSSCSRVAAGNWCCTPSPILLNEGTAHGLLLEEFDNSWFKSWASEGADSA